MVEIEKNYKINVKKFGYVNWIGFWTLYKKEVLRFMIVAIQTIVSPLVFKKSIADRLFNIRKSNSIFFMMTLITNAQCVKFLTVILYIYQ